MAPQTMKLSIQIVLSHRHPSFLVRQKDHFNTGSALTQQEAHWRQESLKTIQSKQLCVNIEFENTKSWVQWERKHKDMTLEICKTQSTGQFIGNGIAHTCDSPHLRAKLKCHLYLQHLEKVSDGWNVAGAFRPPVVLHILTDLQKQHKMQTLPFSSHLSLKKRKRKKGIESKQPYLI